MRRTTQIWMLVIAGLLAALAMLVAACGGNARTVQQATHPAPTAPNDGGASLSSVAPNTFLTFEGTRYRLVDLEQANLVGQNQFEKIGAASQADIDQQDLSVYRRQGDAEAIYTYAPAQQAPTEVAAVEGESGGTPALWYRWVAEP